MMGAPHDLTALLAFFDTWVSRGRSDDRAAVAEAGDAAGRARLSWSASGVNAHRRIEGGGLRVRLLEYQALARLLDECVASRLAAIDAGGISHEQATDADTGRARVTHHLPDLARPLRMGFVVDIVDYGRRPGRLRALAQRRIADLTSLVLNHVGVDRRDVDQQGTGDGVLAFLPPELDVPSTVPRLLGGWRDLLREDNELYRDRLRLRMAMALGPVAPGPLGFVGSPAITTGRLLSSEILRAAPADNPRADMVALISDALHSFAVDPADPAFTRHQVLVKDFCGPAWLWIG
jgi:hypothetical protein